MFHDFFFSINIFFTVTILLILFISYITSLHFGSVHFIICILFICLHHLTIFVSHVAPYIYSHHVPEQCLCVILICTILWTYNSIQQLYYTIFSLTYNSVSLKYAIWTTPASGSAVVVEYLAWLFLCTYCLCAVALALFRPKQISFGTTKFIECFYLIINEPSHIDMRSLYISS